MAWICHFSNLEIRKVLPLSNKIFERAIKSFFGKNTTIYNDFATWNTVWIKEFEEIKDIDLHIIAPHVGLLKTNYEFEMHGIKYHFFKPQDVSIFSQVFRKLKIKKESSDYNRNRKYIRQFIDRIQPDLVNLMGAENPHYSISALDIDNQKVPLVVSLQTVYSDPDFEVKLGKLYSQYRKKVEILILRHAKYFGCGGLRFYDLVKSINPDAHFFKLFFPIREVDQDVRIQKKYDFAFWGNIDNPSKGAIDAIKALSLVKKNIQSVTLNIIGRCSEGYLGFLKDLISELGLQSNVVFSDYFELHDDLFKQIQKSKIALLPFKLDVITSTVREAMMLKMPVVTNATTGTPYLNRDKQVVVLTDIDNIEMLAENMLKVIHNESLQLELVRNATEFYENEFKPSTIAEEIVKTYEAIIGHFYEGLPISKQRLFNASDFPAYK